MELIIPILVVLALSAFFSGCEIAFISASRIEVELQRKTGGRRGRIMAGFFDHPDRFISNMLVGNNIVLVILAIFMNRLLDPWIQSWIHSDVLAMLTNTLITTIVILIFGEFLPKIIFGIYPNRILYFFTYPLVLMKWLLLIPSRMMSGVSNLLLKHIFKVEDVEEIHVFTRLDLEDFVDGRARGGEDQMERDLFKNALHLQSVKVRECMVPRPEIISIDIKSTIDEYIDVFNQWKVSRILVIDDDIDDVLGYVHHLQFLQPPNDVRKILYEIPFVPEVMSVQELMISFIKDGDTIACVVDEFGSISGIITMEDILEEIFGEIEDEHDTEGYVDEQISDTEYLFSGRLEVDYINDKYETIELPTGEYTTLSGYLVMTTETIPDEGDEIELGRYRFIIEQVSDKKIETVRLLIESSRD